ncbi:hypothetical protein V8C34DRAFT_322723 [Trichoderma compactum]
MTKVTVPNALPSDPNEDPVLLDKTESSPEQAVAVGGDLPKPKSEPFISIEDGVYTIHGVNCIWHNMYSESTFTTFRWIPAHEDIDSTLIKVARNVEQGLYSIISLSASRLGFRESSSEYVSTSHSPNQPWPGIWTVCISHGNGFSIPDQYHQALSGVQSGSSLTQPRIPKRPSLDLNGRLLLYVIVDNKYTKWLQIEEGAGEICVEIEYTKNATPEIQAVGGGRGEYLGESCSADDCHIFQVEKGDTYLPYASRKLLNVDNSSHVFLSQADKPFVAPLGFKPRCFDIGRCRFYAAEILCAFESLMQSNPSYRGPKTENILLDFIGHVVLCDLSLYHLDTEKPAHSTVEYPAPEQLLYEHSSTKTSVRWWWTLRIFLYEMLTGVPPFYAESIEKMYERITSSEAIVYPDFLSSSVKDILTGLLDRNPEQRLGAKRGESEIKAHPFFDRIDWNKLMRREYHPDFKPHKITMPFRESRKVRARAKAELMRQFNKGSNYVSSIATGQIASPATVDWNIKFMKMMEGKYPMTERKFPVAMASLPPPPPSPLSPAVKIPINENPDWELVWDQETKVFYFYNCSNNARQLIVPQTFFPRQLSNQAHDDSSTDNVGNLPSQIQKEDALEAALKAGYTHLISQILHKYGDMDLNVELYGFQRAPTLLEFAVEQENANLLQLFVDEGVTDTWGTALFLSVKKGHQELVAILAKVADRVDLTRALGRAVDLKNTAVVDILLASGAKCDFEDSDRPLPPRGCHFPEISDNQDYMPPLVRAVKLGNMELVRLRLAHGADVNVGYHGLHGEHRSLQVIDATCRKVIEAAIELGHRDIVELFLEKEADIHLPQPTWQFHDCPMIPRSVYVRVRTALREVEAGLVSHTPYQGLVI